MKLFVDTSAFIALADKSDQYHVRASEFFQGIVNPLKFESLITSNFVLDETLTRIATTLGPQKAFEFGENLLNSEVFEIQEIDRPLLHDALSLMQKYKDKRLSFTDLTSFAVMAREKIRTAFCFDLDFRNAGFESLP